MCPVLEGEIITAEEDGDNLRLFLLLLQRYTFLSGGKHLIERVNTHGRSEQTEETLVSR